MNQYHHTHTHSVCKVQEQRHLHHSQLVFHSAGGIKHFLKDPQWMSCFAAIHTMLDAATLVQSINTAVLPALVSEDQDVIKVHQMLQATERSRRYLHKTWQRQLTEALQFLSFMTKRTITWQL